MIRIVTNTKINEISLSRLKKNEFEKKAKIIFNSIVKQQIEYAKNVDIDAVLKNNPSCNNPI